VRVQDVLERVDEPSEGAEEAEEGEEDCVKEGLALEPVGERRVENDEEGGAGKVDVRLEKRDHLREFWSVRAWSVYVWCWWGVRWQIEVAHSFIGE